MDRIKIHNFGPVKDVDIALSKMMVFIGPQGSGKSTIAKLLTIFSDVNWWRHASENKNTLLEFQQLNIDKYFNEDTHISFDKDDVHITYADGKFSINIDDIDPDKTCQFCKLLVSESVKEKLIELGVDINNLPQDKSLEKHRDYLMANLRFVCYIPAERNLTGAVSSSLANIVLSKIPLPNTLMEYMSLFERAKNHYSSYDASFLGIQYDKNNGTDCISVIENANKHIPLEACSSGIQSALPMLMVLDYAREDNGFDTYIVEEPEQNLFPTNQRELLNRLIALTKKEECKYLVINTHSPYVLSALNVSMLAERVSKTEKFKDEVDAIVAPEFRIDANNVSVYALGDTPCCKSIIDNKTGLISVNYLDVVSDSISSDFNKLYQIYLKTLQK